MIKIVELRARCTPAEQDALKAVAQYEGLKTSEALRQVVREAAKMRGLWPPANQQAGEGNGDACR